ncbi:MAG: hypothetical protein IPI49_10215 [Myxococcales bacterium]|nr:hypothetical protein [Myxococcales bacterium]
MTDSLAAEPEFGEPTFGEAKVAPAPGNSFSAQPAARRAPLSPPRWLPPPPRISPPLAPLAPLPALPSQPAQPSLRPGARPPSSPSASLPGPADASQAGAFAPVARRRALAWSCLALGLVLLGLVGALEWRLGG